MATTLHASLPKNWAIFGLACAGGQQTQRLYRAQSNQPWIDAKPEELRQRMVTDTNNWNKMLTTIGKLE